MLEHLLRDVAGNVHDRLVACSALGKFGDDSVAIVMPAPLYARVRANIGLDRLESGDVLLRIGRLR